MANAGLRPNTREATGVVALLLLVTAVGLAVRLHGLDRRTITHPESYVPRIEYPDFAGHPPERPDPAAIVTVTRTHDNHPPGYYLPMWVWTGVFGTELVAIRVPSALLGAATIAALYALARRRWGSGVALTAAALLSLHGQHVFWSQQARMWVPATFLAVLSVVLLQSLHRRHRGATAAAYVIVVSSGLWSEYYFWPFFTAQVAWALCHSCEERQPPPVLRLQLLSVLLASPVVLFLKIHWGRSWYLAEEPVADLLRQLIQIPRLAESTFALGPVLLPAPFPVIVSTLVGVVCVGAGIAASRSRFPSPEPRAAEPFVPRATGPLCALAASGFCVAFREPLGGSPLVAVGLVLPWLVLCVWYAGSRTWTTWSSWIRAVREWPGVRFLMADEVVAHAFVPLAVLLAVSLFVPCLVARGLLILTPFLMVLAARGIYTLVANVAARRAAIALLLLASLVSVHQFARVPTSYRDYQALSEAMTPLMRPRDLVLIRNVYWAHPMHFYLKPGEVRSADLDRLFRGQPVGRSSARVWVILFEASGSRDKLIAAVGSLLAQHRESTRVNAPGAVAVLFERSARPRGRR